MRLSVVIPAYNEEKRLPKTLLEIDKYLRRQDYGYEIIVVSDGSRDRTAEVARRMAGEIKNLRLIDNRENHGKGFVVRQGLLAAKGEIRLFTDADNSTSIDQIEKMFPEFDSGYDVVIGSRDVKGAVLDPPQPWIRNIVLGEGFKLLRKIIVGLWDIQDTQCGFKAFSQKAADDILPRCKIDRFAFDPEILVIARKMGYKIKEVPVYWRNDSQSKVKSTFIIRILFDLIRIRWNMLRKIYEQ